MVRSVSKDLASNAHSVSGTESDMPAWQAKAKAAAAQKSGPPSSSFGKSLVLQRQRQLDSLERGQGHHFDCDDTTGETEVFVVAVNVQALKQINADEIAAGKNVKKYEVDPEVFVGASDAKKIAHYKQYTGSDMPDKEMKTTLEKIKLGVIAKMTSIKTLPGVPEHTEYLARLNNHGSVVSNGSQAMTSGKLAKMFHETDGQLDLQRPLSQSFRRVVGAADDKTLHKPHHFPFESSTIEKVGHNAANGAPVAATHFYYEDSATGLKSATTTIARMRNGETAKEMAQQNMVAPPNLGGMAYVVVPTPDLPKELELKFNIKTNPAEIMKQMATPANLRDLQQQIKDATGETLAEPALEKMILGAIKPGTEEAAAAVDPTVKKWVAAKAIEIWEKPNQKAANAVVYRDRRDVMPFNRLGVDLMERWKKDFRARKSTETA